MKNIKFFNFKINHKNKIPFAILYFVGTKFQNYLFLNKISILIILYTSN